MLRGRARTLEQEQQILRYPAEDRHRPVMARTVASNPPSLGLVRRGSPTLFLPPPGLTACMTSCIPVTLA